MTRPNFRASSRAHDARDDGARRHHRRGRRGARSALDGYRRGARDDREVGGVDRLRRLGGDEAQDAVRRGVIVSLPGDKLILRES